MGYYCSCNVAESAVVTCGSYKLISKKARKRIATGKRPKEIVEFDLSDLDEATGGFSSENLLGKGSYGSVYKARLRRINLVAAVKMSKEKYAADNEADILSSIYHPRVVNLLGFGVDPNMGKVIVVEYMPNGSLYDLLHGSGKAAPGWVKRIRFAVQVAWGIHFLHSSSPPIIHRDVKSSNVLIDGDFNCRVSDFGLALRGHVEEVKGRSTPPAGTLGYLDPGYIAPGDLSAKSDVFSFGILLLEIISGRNAIDVDHSPQSVVDWAVPAIKSGNIAGICDPRIAPPEDVECVRRIAVLAARCVRSNAERRPEMAEALEWLKGVYKRVKQTSQMCGSFRRRVGEGGSSLAAKYGALDDSVDVVRNSRRNGSVSSAASAGATGVVIGDRIARSKSTGSAGEITLPPKDLIYDQIRMRRVVLNTKMTTVMLRKSRSTGILRCKRSVNGNWAVARSRTCTRKSSEESKLLGDLNINEKDLRR